MRQVPHIADGDIVSDIACDNDAVGDSYRHLQIVMLEIDVLDASNPDHAEKIVVFDFVWIEWIRNKDIAPVVRCIFILNKMFYFVRAQLPPPVRGPWNLRIALIVFVVAGWKIFFRDEISADAVCWKN